MWDSDAERFDEGVTGVDESTKYGNLRSIRCFKRGKKRGEGSFGTVYECQEAVGGYHPKDVRLCSKVLNVSAMREVELTEQHDEDDEEEEFAQAFAARMAIREVSNMQLARGIDPKGNGLKRSACEKLSLNGLLIDGRNAILPLLEVVQNSLGAPVLIVPQRDLDLSALIKKKHRGIPLAVTRHVARAVLTATAHLHALGIFHRDIKPANVLLCARTGAVQLCDFGTSRLLPAARKVTGRLSPGASRITLSYRSPEVLLGDVGYGLAVDVWSAGVTLAECWLGGHLLKQCSGVIGAMNEVISLVGWPPTEAEWPNHASLPALQLFNLSGAQANLPEVLRRRFDDSPPPTINAEAPHDAAGSLCNRASRTPSRRMFSESLSPPGSPQHRLDAGLPASLPPQPSPADVADGTALLLSLLSRSPFTRPSAASALNHPFSAADLPPPADVAAFFATATT
ncbi:putative CTD kinase subunit alpha-like protein [Diplonema papillatum]|nr:putative CTD kinase subunit alpha-like protein [Diplonema papillatum]|eukprot:gene14732-22533_t